MYFCFDRRADVYDNRYSPLITTGGSDVNIYLVDTGCLTTHRELYPRATIVYDSVQDGKDDGNGHGNTTL